MKATHCQMIRSVAELLILRAATAADDGVATHETDFDGAVGMLLIDLLTENTEVTYESEINVVLANLVFARSCLGAPGGTKKTFRIRQMGRPNEELRSKLKLYTDLICKGE